MNSDVKPLLNEVIITGGAQGKNPGGAKSWTCKHCNGKFSSSYTRIHYHFFGTPPGKKSEIRRCRELLANREEYERVRRMVMEAEKKGVSSSLKNSTLLRQQPKKSTASALDDMFKIMDKNSVDMKVMRGLCANGIPFNVLRNPHFHEMISAINNGIRGYKAPSYEKARTTLLDECKRSLENELAPVKDTWFTHGVSIVSDGWSNVKREPLINIIAANSRGAMFLYAQDFSGIPKTGEVIADFMITAIEEVGSSNVLQIVTDNAANCETAGREIEKIYKHIFWSPCVVHTLNLFFKDLAKELDWFEEIYNIGKSIVKFFLNHSHALAMFRSQSKLELLKVAKTRFASHYILLKRLIDCKEALASTVVLQKWKDWLKTLDAGKRKLGEDIALAVLTDNVWENVMAIVKITKPIYFLIKYCDGDGQKMGEVYERMDNMLGEIREVMRTGLYSECFPQVEKIVLQRWKKMNYPIHCVGFALTPRFYDREYLSKPAPGGLTRKSPNQDIEVITALMEAFNKIAEDPGEAELLRNQYAIFHQRKGIFVKSMTPFLFTSDRSNIRFANKFSFFLFLKMANWNSSLFINPSSITELLILLYSSKSASTSLTVNAVCEAREAGSSYPGNCHFPLEVSTPFRTFTQNPRLALALPSLGLTLPDQEFGWKISACGQLRSDENAETRRGKQR
ncbi:putative ribonuclease H-like domain-containing protein [Rosa chinensis]|uniref:Putative ribonuclease H-like domain-containing protein n=1 Tax=Rosa chinensis TaxID=74649 RepID=A0A2P6PDK7_ROSCH|nr:putative ribonuclease H-like domain-containing protein [Rosa chinensis]